MRFSVAVSQNLTPIYTPFAVTPLVVPPSIRARIAAALGDPIISVNDDLLVNENMVDGLFITPALQMYFTYWPLKLKAEYAIAGTYDIPFPNDRVFGVTMARVATAQPCASFGKSPFMNEVILHQVSGGGSYGKTPYGRDPYITTGIAIKEQTERMSYISLRKAGNSNIDVAGKRLWGFSSVSGNLVVDWAMWSKDFADVRFEHVEDVIKVCQMYALEYVGGLRSQSDPNTGVTADGSSFLDKADKIKEEIVTQRWRGRVPVIVLP